MKKFYDTYKDNEIVTPLVTQINWTNHLLIMSGCKTDYASFSFQGTLWRIGMATAGCFSKHEFIYMIWLWR